MRIVVIGAGVIGATVAARLAQRGAKVTLVEQAGPGVGTTSTSYAWINANGKEPQAYYALNRAGLEEHARISPEGEAGWLGHGGHVEIAIDDRHRDDLAARAGRHGARDYKADQISVERARELLPDVNVPDDAKLIVHYPIETYAYPMKYLAHMLGEARDAGVELRTGCKVTALRGADGGAVVELADGTQIAGDMVVSAVGRWTAPLATLAGVSVPVREFAEPGDIVVGYLAVTSPVPVRLTRLITSPWLNVRPAGGGRLMLQALDLDVTADPRVTPKIDGKVANTLLGRLKDLVRNTEAATIEQIMVGQRAMPEDGRTIVGRAPGASWLYVIATHSGVTLAPYLGKAVAAEILGEPQAAFDEFRLERFMSDTTYGQPYKPRRPGQQ